MMMMKWLFVIVLCLGTNVRCQTIRHHKTYLCDDAGKLDGIRLKRTLDFVLCRDRYGEKNYCRQCRCEWVNYVDAVQACSEEDQDLQNRLELSRNRWEADYAEFCLDGEENPTREQLTFSLDSRDANWCNDGSKRASFGIVTTFVMLYLLLR